MKQIMFLILLLLLIKVNGQITNTTNTVGLLYSEPEKVSEGYLLFVPLGSQNAYLIDNCGLIVNQWAFTKTSVYSGCYLLEDGSVLNLTNDYPYGYKGSESCIERRSWNDELIWEYCIDSEVGEFHSDMHILPNGNVLILMQEYFSVEEAILSGVNPSLLKNNYNLEAVLELKPLGIDSAEIVWQWRMKDHLIQEFDESKDNYGIIAEHPRKYDANLFEDFTHFNSIDYNESLDQIVVSSWNDHEIYIIDHSTTIEEAAESSGGKYGYGGDFLFRWGNPSNYGVEKEQRLLGQHNPRWIPEDFERFGGMLSIYNNRYEELLGNNLEKSAVVVINPDLDRDGVYEMEGSNFLPESYEYVLPNTGAVIGGPMFSNLMSGAVVQPNGNIVTCEAEKGRLTEFDEDGKVVWMYQCPIGYYYIFAQGTRANSQVYKVEKYKADYPGLLGRDLCGTSIIENENMLSDECAQFWSPNIAFLFAINGAEVDFTLSAQNHGEVSWDFGEGNTSTEDNPTHIFEMPGTYEVCVNGSNCFGNDSYCKAIEITATSIEQFNHANQLLTTNIINDKLLFSVNSLKKISIFNEAGLVVKQMENPHYAVEIQNLPAGIYFLQAEGFKNKPFKVERFVKL